MSIKQCDCGCLITPQSISKVECDGCYYESHRKREAHSSDFMQVRTNRRDRMALDMREGR